MQRRLATVVMVGVLTGLVGGAASAAVEAETAPLASAAKKKPKLKNACKLLSNRKLSAIVGKHVLARHKLRQSSSRYKFGCRWDTKRQGKAPAAGVDLTVLPFKSRKAAKAEYKFRRSGPFSPPPNKVRGIGDAAFTFGGLITVRSGRYVLEAGTNDPDVIGQPASTSKANAYAKKIAKPAVRKLRKSYR